MMDPATTKLCEDAFDRAQLLELGPIDLRSSLASRWVARTVAYLTRAGSVSAERLGSVMGRLEVSGQPDWPPIALEIARWLPDLQPTPAGQMLIVLFTVTNETMNGEPPELVNCMRMVLDAADLVGQFPIEVHRLAAEVSEAAAAQGSLGLGPSWKVPQ